MKKTSCEKSKEIFNKALYIFAVHGKIKRI